MAAESGDGWGRKGNVVEYNEKITRDNYQSLGYEEYCDACDFKYTPKGYSYHLGKDGSVSSTFTYGSSYDNVETFFQTYDTRQDIITPLGSVIKGKGNGVFPTYSGSITDASKARRQFYQWNDPGARIGMGVMQGSSIMASDYAGAKILGYGVKGYYTLSQSKLTTSSFNLHPRLTNLNTSKFNNKNQFDAMHRGTAFFSDEILQTGKISTDFNSIFLNRNTVNFKKNLGGKNLGIGINPFTKTIIHQGPVGY